MEELIGGIGYQIGCKNLHEIESEFCNAIWHAEKRIMTEGTECDNISL